MDYKHGAYAIIDTSKAKRINEGNGSITPVIPDNPVNPTPDVAFAPNADGSITISNIKFVPQDDGVVLFDGAVFTALSDATIMIGGT